jgi:Tol biopolymer transport system component
MNPDGSNQVDITNTPASNEDSPAWSADGERIAYVRDRAIWTMNADGSLQTQVVMAPITNGCNPFPPDALGGPAWSPDGSKIVFHKFTCTRDPDDEEIPAFDLYTVNPEGTGQALLKREGMGPRWSPDGTKIGYTSFCYGGGCTSVRWVTADGSQEFTVYQSNLDNDNFVDWSPDGFLLAGVGERPCAPCFESYTIHPDGTGYTVRPNGVGNWSPDGTKFVQGGVYVQNVDGSGRTQIASSGSSPDWQPIPYTGYPRPKGATPLRTYLVPAYKPCTAPNRTHGSPLASPSCNPPARASSFLTVGTPDANGQGAKSIGSVFMAARPADMVIGVSITDVRNASDLSDYTGDLQEIANWRITDDYNGPSLTDPATMVDIPFPVFVPCAVTGDTTVGSTCAVSTTGNAVVPGSVRAGKREVVELGQVQVYDGGSDGNAATTADNTLFMNEGVFTP